MSNFSKCLAPDIVVTSLQEVGEHKLWDLEPVCEHDDGLILECAEELFFNSLLFFSEENRDVFERSIDQKSLPSPVKVY